MQIKKMNNNAGFSLVELIVVVALLAVVMGGSLITYYTISSHNIDKAKGYIEDSLNECRSRAMSTQAKKWEIVISESEVVVYKTDESDNVIDIQGNKMPSNVSIQLQQSNDVATYTVSEAEYDEVRISFKKLSGEIGKVSVVRDGATTEIYSSDEAQYCDIILNYRNRTKKIRLYYATGKFVADD